MSFSIKEWALRWGPACFMMILIFAASGTPGEEIPGFGAMDLFVKKGSHLLGYALLGVAYLRGLAWGDQRSPGRLFLAVLLAFTYAATDEFHQSFTPGRSPSAEDVVIDTLGAGAGVLLWSRICAGYVRLFR